MSFPPEYVTEKYLRTCTDLFTVHDMEKYLAQSGIHVSAAEVDYQEVQQSAAIAFAVVTCTVGQADQMLQNIIDYVQAHTQAEITNIDRVIY